MRLEHGDGAVFTAVSGRDGRFEIDQVPPGRYRVTAGHGRYLTIEDELEVDGSGRTHLIELRIATRVIPLEPLVVRVAPRPPAGILQPVHDRIEAVRLWGGGTVFSREDIERRNPARVTFMLDEVRGVRVETLRRGGGRTFPMIVSTRTAGLCPMSVYLDGVRVVTGGKDAVEDIRRPTTADFVDINGLIRTSEAEAIEIYHPGSRIPPEYWGSYAGCGVVLLWTRR